MAGISNYLRDKVLNFIRGTAMGSAPTSYTGLWSGNPTAAGSGGTEVSNTVSSRQQVNWNAASSKIIENNGTVNWGASGGSATIDNWGVLDSATQGAGNLLWYGGFTQAKSVTPGDTLEIDDGGMQFSSSGSMTDALMEAVMDWIAGNAFPFSAGTVYVALFNGDPKGAGSEVTTTIRVAGRVAVTFAAPASGVIQNSADVDFGNANGAATVTHAAIYSAASGGDMYLSEVLQASISPAANDIVKFTSGALQFTLA